MKKLFFAVLMTVVSSVCFAQSNGMFVTLRVTDSIWLNGTWVKQFSNDSTMGNGSTGIVPTEKAIKGALSQLVPLSEKGVANGIAGLDENGKVPSGQLALSPADIPGLDASKITTGVLPLTRGGTGLSALGTPNQLLRVNSAATALEYFTPNYWNSDNDPAGLSITAGPLTGGNVFSGFTFSNGRVTNYQQRNMTAADIGAAPASGSPNYAPAANSSNYIHNGLTAQAANFSITGQGVIGNNLTVAGAVQTVLLYVKNNPGAGGAYSIGFNSSVDSRQYFNMGIVGTVTNSSDEGADFALRRFGDSQSPIDMPLFIKRSNGNVGIGGFGNGSYPAEKLHVIGRTKSGGLSLGATVITVNYTATTNDYTIINQATTGNPTITLTGGSGTVYTLVEEAANPTANGMNWTPVVRYKGATYSNANNAALSAYSRFTVQNVNGTWYLISAN